MEFNLDAQIKTIKPYAWLLYPLAVLVFIWFSYTQILVGPGKLLDKITQTEEKISDLNLKKTVRETKINTLKVQKLDILQTMLASLIEQMPYDHMPRDLLTKLKTQGDLTDFKMSENKLMQVEFKIEDSDKLEELIQKLELFTPLLSISSVVYSPPLLKFEFNSGFEPFQKFSQDFGRQLPNLSK
ncbi:MAG: hypothetical protein Q8L51_03445 [Candidatus Amesbacteria bacterium]|nr:hypothetical protein [Candidatus Amesbacteria bacterium]